MERLLYWEDNTASFPLRSKGQTIHLPLGMRPCALYHCSKGLSDPDMEQPEKGGTHWTIAIQRRAKCFNGNDSEKSKDWFHSHLASEFLRCALWCDNIYYYTAYKRQSWAHTIPFNKQGKPRHFPCCKYISAVFLLVTVATQPEGRQCRSLGPPLWLRLKYLNSWMDCHEIL